MTKTSINLQELKRRIYVKAKTEDTWRFWGLYVHVHKLETLQAAYKTAKANNGSPGEDGVTFEEIEKKGVNNYLEEIQKELKEQTYSPYKYREKKIPKGKGKYRTLKIPSIRDRIVEGALKQIIEPIFEADFQEGSYGYRPNRQAHMAIKRVEEAITKRMTVILDIDLTKYFDNIRHDILLKKVAQRVNDDKIMWLTKRILKSAGKRGICQGSVISPLFSNLYLNEVDKMLEKAKQVTGGKYQQIEYARFADDLVILISNHEKQSWLVKLAWKRLQEELSKIQVEINTEKSKILELTKGGSFDFLGFTFSLRKSIKGKIYPHKAPKKEARNKLLSKLRLLFKTRISQPIRDTIDKINPILRGWVNYFRIGNSSKCFGYIKQWVMRKIRRILMKSRKRKGFGWKRWSNEWIYKELGLYSDYQIIYL